MIIVEHNGYKMACEHYKDRILSVAVIDAQGKNVSKNKKLFDELVTIMMPEAEEKLVDLLHVWHAV